MLAFPLPQFSQIDEDKFPDQLEQLLNNNLQGIAKLLASKSYSWEGLMQPLENLEDELEQLWSPISHLHAVVNSQALRNCYQACLPKLTAYSTAIGQNKKLYEAIKSIDQSQLNAVQKKIIQDELQDFELSGVALDAEKKKRFEEIQLRLSELSNQFENNVLDATQAFQIHITDVDRLAGLPEHTLATAQALAVEKGLPGWVLTLEFPNYVAVITYAEDRNLREEMYRAYITRASDQGPSAGQFDNSVKMNEMLALRNEKAKLLGFQNYAELSLATKMAESPAAVIRFLTDLSQRAYAQAVKEFQDLSDFAQQQNQGYELQPWDIAYFSEKKKQANFAISQEELRAYFPLKKVIAGLFIILQKLYGISLKPLEGIDVWHPDVQCYQVIDENEEPRGYIYMDLFARRNKRGGAWMDSLRGRSIVKNGQVQTPIATLTCNFAPAMGQQDAYLSHEELETLFHELGHCLHHVLTQVDYLSVAGINGVEWDAVELPSQFFENWCWEQEALALLSEHRDSKMSIPAELFSSLQKSKYFQSAMLMERQLEFSLFDFYLHFQFSNEPNFVLNTLNAVRKKTCVVPVADYNRFPHSFTHIFSGGYAAGYYSYKWAEVLSSDAFSRFKKEGIFNSKTGRDFLHEILEVGGSKKAADAFINFRGRSPNIDALLADNGIK